MSVKGHDRPESWVRANADFELEWPGSSAIATECSLNLIALADAIQARAERWAQAAGVPSVAAANVLAILRGAGEPLLPSLVAERMLVTRSNLTGILRTLERRGLVARVASEHDGRQRPAAITPVGRQRIEKLQNQFHRTDKQLFGVLAPGQQKALLQMLAVLETAIKQHRNGLDEPNS